MLYKHCVHQFRDGLKVGNVVVRLVLAHDSGLAALEEAGMCYFEANAIVFQVSLAFLLRFHDTNMCELSLKNTLSLENREEGATLHPHARYTISIYVVSDIFVQSQHAWLWSRMIVT